MRRPILDDQSKVAVIAMGWIRRLILCGGDEFIGSHDSGKRLNPVRVGF